MAASLEQSASLRHHQERFGEKQKCVREQMVRGGDGHICVCVRDLMTYAKYGGGERGALIFHTIARFFRYGGVN